MNKSYYGQYAAGYLCPFTILWSTCNTELSDMVALCHLQPCRIHPKNTGVKKHMQQQAAEEPFNVLHCHPQIIYSPPLFLLNLDLPLCPSKLCTDQLHHWTVYLSLCHTSDNKFFIFLAFLMRKVKQGYI